MKIFFTASLRAKNEGFEKNILYICNALRSEHDLCAEHILDNTLEKVSEWSFEQRLSYYGNIYKQIKNCDFFIAEVSYPSANVGYEVALALDAQKQVFLLHKSKTSAIISLLNVSEYPDQLHVIKYADTNLSSKLAFINSQFTNNNDKRFTILLPSYIINHLTKISRKMKMPRSVYIRSLIENDMKDDL
jgi:hypothetical protein